MLKPKEEKKMFTLKSLILDVVLSPQHDYRQIEWQQSITWKLNWSCLYAQHTHRNPSIGERAQMTHSLETWEQVGPSGFRKVIHMDIQYVAPLEKLVLTCPNPTFPGSRTPMV